MTQRRRSGFTLIEIMVAVAIVGVMSTIALPSYLNMRLRTRKSERDVVMNGVQRGIAAVLVRDGRLTMPPGDDGSSAPFTGGWNPDDSPGIAKRPMVTTRTDAWKLLELNIEGGVYHSYMFTLLDDSPVAFAVTAMGDLDGDHQTQRKIVAYELRNGNLMQSPDQSSFVPDGDVLF